MASFKLDIFKLLSKIDSSKKDIYLELTDEEKKCFFTLVVMRWNSGTNDEQQIQLINTFVNPYVFNLANHPHLLMQLLQVSSTKERKKYQWLAIKSNDKSVLTNKVIKEHFDISDRELKLMAVKPTPSEILLMAEELGWQKEEISKLKKELQ